jgi:hypothetical protein
MAPRDEPNPIKRAALEMERKAIIEALKTTNGSVRAAAKHLQMKHGTLDSMLRPGGRHEDLRPKAEEIRRASGWSGTGRPPAAATPPTRPHRKARR